MNLKKLKKAEKTFLRRYPGGFNNPEMIEIKKKHKIEKMMTLTQESFARENFLATETILENMVKIINRSSMVSMFEKPKFRDFVNSLFSHDKELLVSGLEQQLYGDEKKGFEIILDILKSGKLAKWSLITICPNYFNPSMDVFVKPTTTKGVIEYFELKSLQYKPLPSWAFYEEYRSIINEMKTHVEPSLSQFNTSFSGFLMMSLPS